MTLSAVPLLVFLLAALCSQIVLSVPSFLNQQKQRENISLFEVTSSVLPTNPPWTPERYPNPFIDHVACKRPRRSFVCDPDNIITEEEGKGKP